MRRLLLALGLGRLVCIGTLVLAALVLFDFVWHFGHVERFVALAALIATLAFILVRDLVQPLQQKWSDKDVLRTPMKVERLPIKIEQLTWQFLDMTADGGRMSIMWDTTMGSVPFRVSR